MDHTAAATLFAWMDRELWLLTAQADGCRAGMIVSSVNLASTVPDMPRVLVALGNGHHTRELVEASGTFALHLLCEKNLDLVWQFGLTSGHDGDKFGDLSLSTSASDNPVVNSTIGWLDCRVEARQDVGGRTLYVAEVIEGRVTNFAPPLTMQHLMQLAPAPRLTQLQLARHFQGCDEVEEIQHWRERSSERGG